MGDKDKNAASLDAAEVTCETGAEALLVALRDVGVSYLFANAGTDFPPVIEGLSRLPGPAMPEPVTIPHETAGAGMAHGYWLVTGEPQALMVHVHVGLANSVMGVINAMSDAVPMIVMSGRTPLTETGREGARQTPIQYGQEMFDQTSLVRDSVKYNYEIRYPEQCDSVLKRAATIATSTPEGPVYLSLPREPLGEALPENFVPAPIQASAKIGAPDATDIATLAKMLEAADNPVILCPKGDPAGRVGETLSKVAADLAIAVAEPFSIRNVLASNDPMLIGYDPAAALKGADLVIVLDACVPWIAASAAPGRGAKVVHIAPDPHFTRLPVRGYQCDLAIQAEPAAALVMLQQAMPQADRTARRATVAARAADRSERAQQVLDSVAPEDTIAPPTLSRAISDVMDETAVVFNELGLMPGMMRLKGPNRVFTNPHSGGLGWALPAALGAQLADRDRLVIAAIGDGSYIFSNPVACHQIAEALQLPVLIVIKNNAMWNAVRRSIVRGYPDGAAMRRNKMPLTSLSPLPDFASIARASRAHGERVELQSDLAQAFATAIRVIREERRCALLDVKVAATDAF